MMGDRRGKGSKKAANGARTHKGVRRSRSLLPRSVGDLRSENSFTLIETWNQLPLVTKLYVAIIAALSALLLLLFLVRTSSLNMGLGFLRSLQGGSVSDPGSLASSTASTVDNTSGAPVAIAQVNAELRSGPAVSYSSVGLLETGQTAEITGVSVDGFWWAVKIPYVEGERAWVASDQVQSNNTDGVQVLAMPSDNLATTQFVAEPAIATALMNVNIRSGPGLDYPKIGLLFEGQEAELVGVDADRFWYVIRVPGEQDLQGWVSKDYVKTKNADGLPVIGPQAGTPMLIPITIVNIRAGPGKEFAIIGSLEKGQAAEVVGVSADGQWLVIKFAAGPDGYGWVSANFVNVESTQDIPVFEP